MKNAISHVSFDEIRYRVGVLVEYISTKSAARHEAHVHGLCLIFARKCLNVYFGNHLSNELANLLLQISFSACLRSTVLHFIHNCGFAYANGLLSAELHFVGLVWP